MEDRGFEPVKVIQGRETLRQYRERLHDAEGTFRVLLGERPERDVFHDQKRFWLYSRGL